MSLRNLKAAAANDVPDFYRSIIADPWRSLDQLERCTGVAHVLRHKIRNLVCARIALTPEEGKGYSEITRIQDDILVGVSHCTNEHPLVDFTPADDLVQFNFKLSSEASYRVSRTMPDLSNQGPLLVWRQPLQTRTRDPMEPSSRTRSVSVGVRPKFLLTHLLPSRDEIPRALRRLVFTTADGCGDYLVPMTRSITAITTKLVDNPHQGKLRPTYIEALSLQLLCSAVTNFWSLPDQPDEEYSTLELRAISTARQILAEQHTSSLKKSKIARSVGLSQKALETGFTTVYGESLSSFRLRCRARDSGTLRTDGHSLL